MEAGGPGGNDQCRPDAYQPAVHQSHSKCNAGRTGK